MNCPKCDADISDTYEPNDPSCGINEGWYCDACDHAVAGWEHPREPLEGDVGILPTEPVGTPISEISGRPGQKGFSEFVRISKSWGHD